MLLEFGDFAICTLHKKFDLQSASRTFPFKTVMLIMKIPTLLLMLLAAPDAPNLVAGMPITVDDSLLSAFKNEHCVKDDTILLYHVLQDDGTIDVSSERLISVAGATPKPSRFASTVHCGASGQCPTMSMGVTQKVCEQSGAFIEIFHNPLDPTEIERIKVRENLDSKPLDSNARLVGNGLLGAPVQLWKIKGTRNVFTTIPAGSFDDVKCVVDFGDGGDSQAPPPAVRRNLRHPSFNAHHDGVDKNANAVVPAFNRDVLQERDLQQTEVADGCGDTCYELKLGIALDSEYCTRFGSNNFATTQSHIEQLVEDMSDFYEVVGICTRLRIGYLEIVRPTSCCQVFIVSQGSFLQQRHMCIY
jgi:hypothetical protein